MEVLNRSINQTLSRTVITAVMFFLSALALYLYGGASMEGLAETHMIGAVIVVLSSIPGRGADADDRLPARQQAGPAAEAKDVRPWPSPVSICCMRHTENPRKRVLCAGLATLHHVVPAAGRQQQQQSAFRGWAGRCRSAGTPQVRPCGGSRIHAADTRHRPPLTDSCGCW